VRGASTRIPLTPLTESGEGGADGDADKPAGDGAGAEAEEEEDPWQDRKLVLLSTLTQCAGLYGASQACWLAVFVPQICPPVLEHGTSPWFDLPLDPADHVCSVTGARARARDGRRAGGCMPCMWLATADTRA
jgi:hypothetical protein